MANTLYKNLFSQINKLFNTDYLLRDNIPEDIYNWYYNAHNMELYGKVLYINNIIDSDICIIKDNNTATDAMLKDIILLDNKKCKVIIISRDFLSASIESVQGLIYNIYNFILKDLFIEYKEYSLGIANRIAPFILTMNTMSSFGLTYSYKLFNIIDEDIYNILVSSSDYDVKSLLDDGLLFKLIVENYKNKKQ